MAGTRTVLLDDLDVNDLDANEIGEQRGGFECLDFWIKQKKILWRAKMTNSQKYIKDYIKGNEHLVFWTLLLCAGGCKVCPIKQKCNELNDNESFTCDSLLREWGEKEYEFL